MTKWRFHWLTPEKKLLARQLYAESKTNFRAMIQLMDLYNDNRVSPDYLTPCCALQLTIDFTEWAIKNGEI